VPTRSSPPTASKASLATAGDALADLLSRDGWRLRPTGPEMREDHGACLAARRRNREILFFRDTQDPRLLRRAARAIAREDGEAFRRICVLVVRSTRAMATRRRADKADDWPRGFFVSLDELSGELSLMDGAAAPTPSAAASPGIETFDARVLANIPVGEGEPTHYKLRFRANALDSTTPGQFIMIDTLSRESQRPFKSHTHNLHDLSLSFDAPEPYLKRPFGLHRAFYPHFAPAYLRNLALPPTLARVLHTTAPSEFDVLCKVLEHGVGTTELAKLKRGRHVQLIGPLGKRFDLRAFARTAPREVHVIGGGVGVAPLIFLVQGLRFLGLKVKAFIGVETFESLRHRDDLAASYVADPRDVRVYVDDLVAAGLARKDIYVSCEKESKIGRALAKRNQHTGFISEQYEAYLNESNNADNAAAFACGPTPMMKAVYDITKPRDIALKVLMEKRMACGVGVCLSCVCKTKTGPHGYSRVCTEGPIFDADEIEWS